MSSCAMDANRISQLPDHIIHHILSFLPTKDVVRLSVLSKEWYRLFTCFPISHFGDFSLSKRYKTARTWGERILKYANFVYTSLLRQSLQSRYIPNFQLDLRVILSYREMRTLPVLQQHKHKVLTNRSIRLGTQYGVKELALEFDEGSNYRLPQSMFVSAKQLVVCKLISCVINAPTINWPSLREFYLVDVDLRDQSIIDNLSFTCPLIEKISLDWCSGLDCLRLSGFTKLKLVRLLSIPSKKIEIDALSLQTFYYSSFNEDRETQINMNDCKNLEVLKIYSTRISDRAVQDLISKFPALKVLECPSYESIKISNQQLEKLKLDSYDMVEAIIDAPMLKLFKFSIFGKIPSLFSLNTTSLHEVHLSVFRLNCGFQELNKVFRNFNQIKTLYLFFNNIYHEIANIVSYISSPIQVADINHLELNIKLSGRVNHAIAEANLEALMDGLFWICHPKSLLVPSGCYANNKVMTFICKKLMLREKHCCAASKVKCWLHYLEGFKIEHCEINGERKVLTCDALLDSLQTLAQDEEIYFVFDWKFNFSR